MLLPPTFRRLLKVDFYIEPGLRVTQSDYAVEIAWLAILLEGQYLHDELNNIYLAIETERVRTA
jgi:hypothetical protein